MTEKESIWIALSTSSTLYYKSSGTGLGLAICRQELEEWGSIIEHYPKRTTGHAL